MGILKKRKLFIVLILSFCLLVGCGSGSSKTPVATKKAGITLTFGHHESAFPKSGIIQKLALEFEKETGIHIKFEQVTDAQWRDFLKAKLADGTAPDIFAVDSDPFSLYEKIRPDINCIDLSGEEFIKRMDKEVLPSISYQSKTYGITFAGKKMWLYSYNKSIFKKLKLKVPTNYQEFKHVCQVIKKAGTIPIWEAPASGWQQVLPLFEIGPYYLSKNKNLYRQLNQNKINLDQVTDIYRCLKQINEFAKLSYYGDDYFGNAMENEIKEFVSGKYAMVLEGVGWPNMVATQYPQMKNNIGIFVMPWLDNQIIGVNPTSNAYFGNEKSKYKKEILEFFRFLAKKENLQKRLEGDPDSLEVCWPEIKERYPQEIKDYLAKHKTGIVMQAGVSYIDSQWMDIGADIEKMFGGLMTPKEVFKELVDRRNKLAIMMKDPYWVSK